MIKIGKIVVGGVVADFFVMRVHYALRECCRSENKTDNGGNSPLFYYICIMQRPYKLILIIAVLLTGVTFIHDYLYDPPPSPYTTGDYVVEFVIGVPLFTTVFFGIILGVYLGIKKIMQKISTYLS